MPDNPQLRKKITTFLILFTIIMLVIIGVLIFSVFSVLFNATGIALWIYSGVAVVLAISIFTTDYWLSPILNKMLGINPDHVDF